MFAVRTVLRRAPALPIRVAVAPRALVAARPFHSVRLNLNPNNSVLDHHVTTEFDADAGEFVPKEVSIHDRRQTNLSEQQKEAARVSDYDGDRKSAQYMAGLDPAHRWAPDTTATAKQADDAIEQAESMRDA